MTKLEIHVHDAETGSTRIERYTESPVRIGRNPSNELRLEFGFVSGFHARIDFDQSGATFVDLGSTNGSTIAGRKLAPHEPVAIDEGLRVNLGKLALRLALERSESATGGQAGTPTQVLATATRPIPAAAEPAVVEPRVAEPREGAEATGFVDLGGVHRAIRALRPTYERFEAARVELQREADEALAALPPSTRDTALAFLRREFPTMPGATPFASTPAGGHDAHAERAGPLATALLHDVEVPSSPADEAAFVARIVEVMQTAAQAFVEIRNVQARFGEEMGVRTIREYTPLHSAADARAVLDYLLDWRRGGSKRSAQLAAVYSDFLLHQVALINGIVDGVEALVDPLRPAEIERGVGGLNKAAGAWKKYAERYNQLIEERGVAALVFGPEFARAYARVGSGSDPS